MPRVDVNGVGIEYETFGDPDNPVLILISGGGAQMTFWQEEFCQRLAAKGFQVVRFDNRDAGVSTSFDEYGFPDVPAVRDGRVAPPYTLDDMAADTIGLVDALGAKAAHVVGISLGGYITQVMAINHPDRVLSFVSMASGVGGPDNIYGNYEYAIHGMPEDDAGRPKTMEEQIELRLDEIEWMSTPQYFDRDRIRPHIARSMARNQNPDGVERQAAAVHAGPSRAPALANVRVPALVLHGALDPHLPVENAHRTAAAIPGSKLVILPDLAHDMPAQKWDEIIDIITEHATAAGAAARS
ncbi:MAG: alpha/beta fold hydrolase [Candidatus Limnocylindria bacterium]